MPNPADFAHTVKHAAEQKHVERQQARQEKKAARQAEREARAEARRLQEEERKRKEAEERQKEIDAIVGDKTERELLAELIYETRRVYDELVDIEYSIPPAYLRIQDDD